MISRTIEGKLLGLARQYPVITITGPRQSGKTTVSVKCFPEHLYLSLEDPDVREHARKDPRGFLAQSETTIIDEVQHVPDLVSYIQGIVDRSGQAGQFILTGSHQFSLTDMVSQSLAGRTALVNLLPFSLEELGEKSSYENLIYRGFYPAIIDRNLNPTEALSFYTNTYIQRDLRDIREIKSLRQFESFLRLCASNVGQMLNKTRMANDIGVDGKTVDAWISVLEASYIVYLLPPHYRNFRKRIVKTPKLYFCDVGLASYLLGISTVEHVKSHPLKGMLFENLVVMEKVKRKLNNVESPSLYFFRDNTGNEVDLLEQDGADLVSYEIKTTQTLSSGLFKGLNFYKKLNPDNKRSVLIYTGREKTNRYGHECLPFWSV